MPERVNGNVPLLTFQSGAAATAECEVSDQRVPAQILSQEAP